MKLNKRNYQKSARVELLPLIDVIFLLLIFFIFVMLKMNLQNVIKIDLPQVINTIQETDHLLTIDLNANNEIFIKGEKKSLVNFIEKVNELQEINKRPILIQGDQNADLGVALAILDRLRMAGFLQISFATTKAELNEAD